MSDTPAPAPVPPPEKSSRGCIWAIVISFGLSIALLFGAFVFFGEAARQFADKLTAGFFSSKVEVTASQVLVEIGRTHGDVLEVASPTKTVEIMKRSDTRFAAWGWFYVGTATSEIRVPATYRFHIKLSEMKNARIENGVLSLTVPTIHPSLPVAFDTKGMEKRSGGSWLRFDADAQLADMEKNLTAELNARAVGHATNVKEAARKDIEEFVEKWIVQTHPVYQKQIHSVKILFDGEKADQTPIPVAPLP